MMTRMHVTPKSFFDPPAKQPITNAIEKARPSDIRKADENFTVDDHKDSRIVGKLTSSAVLSNFQSMTINDTVLARKIAKQLSDTITDMVNLNTLSCGPNLPTTLPQSNTLQDELNTSDATLDFSKEKAEFILRASTHVDNILKTTTEQPYIPKSDNASGEKCNKSAIQPTSEQMKTLQMIEDRWQRIGIGSVVHGPRSSGKAIVACSLLHRNRSHGPQLLVCSSASVVCIMGQSIFFFIFAVLISLLLILDSMDT